HLPRDVHRLASFVAVLEQLAAGQAHHLSHGARDAPVAQLADLPLAGLAFVVEVHDVAVNGNVPLAQRGDAETAVLLRVHLASRPHETAREDPQDARHRAVAREAGERKPPVDLPAQPGERPPERDEAVVLLLLALDDRAVVVPVLPAPRLVLPDGLHLGLGRPAYGDVGPGGWDLELVQPVEVLPACP